jgi:hypothetical protein
VAATGYEEISQRAVGDAWLDGEAPVSTCILVCCMHARVGVTRAYDSGEDE